MIKKFASLLLLSTFPLFSIPTELPTVMDFAQFPTMEKGANGQDSYQLGCNAFNLAPELTPIFALLQRKYQISTVVETGSFVGNTTILFGYLFDEVHTVEINSDFYQITKSNLKGFSNVKCYLGSSEQVFKKLLPSLKNKTVLFYLDAHWEAFWPLLDELEEISKTHRDNCVIVIDDFKVPGRVDIPYDAYWPHECSLEYIEEKLNKIFTSYSVHYLIPKSILSRAKFIAIPHNFKKKSNKNKKKLKEMSPFFEAPTTVECEFSDQ
jgi:predicted O-methyltransferase YrrM